METYKEFENRYGIVFDEEHHQDVLDVFNNDYALEDVKDNAYRVSILGLKHHLIYKDDKKFKKLNKIAIDMGCKDAYFPLLNYHVKRGEYNEAEEICKKLEECNHDLGKVYLSYGYISVSRGDDSEVVISHYKKGVELGHDGCRKGLGGYYLKIDKYREAIDVFEQVENKIPSNYYSLAFSYYKLGELDKMEHYLTFAPDYEDLLRGIIFYDKGEYEKSLEKLSLAKENKNCILQTFAIEEMVVCLFQILKRYDDIIAFTDDKELSPAMMFIRAMAIMNTKQENTSPEEQRKVISLVLKSSFGGYQPAVDFLKNLSDM